MKFDLLGAKRAGYSDAEIAEYAGPQFGFDVSSARNAGYSNTEIVRALALKSFESDPPSRKSFLDVSRLFSPQASDADLSDQWRRFYQPQGAIDDIDGRGTIAETGIGLIRGAMGRLPEQVGKALKWMGDAPQGDAVRGSTLHEIGQSLENVGSDNAQGEALRARPGSKLARAFGTGAEMVAPSLAPLVTATIGSVAGPAGTAAGFVAGTVGLGMSQAQDTYERAKAANLSDADASAAAWKTGAIEALGETAGGLALGWAFGMLGRVAGKAAGVSPVQAVFEAYRNPRVFKEFAKRLPGVYAAEIGTEMGQSAGQAAVERAAGIPGQDPGEAAIDVIAPTAAMTTLLAPLGIAGQRRAARAQTFVGGAAADPEADPRLRTAAVQQIGEALRAADPAFASAWLTYAREQIAAKQPVELGEAIPRNGTDRAVGWILDSGTAEDAIAAAAKGVEQAGAERDPMAIDFSSTDADLARIEGHYEARQEAERLARQRAEIPGIDFERGIIGQQMRDAEFDAAVRQRDEAVAAAQARAKMAADQVRDRDEEMAAAARAERDAKIGSILRERQDEDAAQDIARRLQEHDARGLTTPLAQAYRAGLVRRLEQLGFEAPANPAEVAAANEPVRAQTTPEVVAGLPAPAQRLEPEVSVSDIHRAAEARGIRWDDDPAFMAFTKGVTGKERLDELDAGERATMLAAVERRQAPAQTVDAGAHEAAASPLNDKTASREQILGGNAELGHPRVGGMDLSIENPAGSERRDLQNDPPRWRRTMRGVHYGYIKGTVGADKDHLDVFVREGTPEDWSGIVFVVNQNHPDGRFDEHKAVVGVTSEAEARRAYLDQYDAGQEKNIRSIVALPVEEFKAWAYDKSKAGPRGGELKAKALPAAAPQAGWLFVEYGGRRYPVTSLEDAGERWSEFREASGAGASQIGDGARIVDAGGKEVARISYNGKVWPPGEWQPGQRPLVGKTFEEERADADAIDGSAQVVEEKPAARKQPVKLSGIKVFGKPVEKLTAKELKIAAKKAATEKQRDAARDEILRRASIEPTEKQKKAREEAKQRFTAMAAARKRIDVDRDSIVLAIIKMGGVKMAERADITGDTKGKNPGIPGVGFLFTTEGLGVDDVAMRLGELDYLSRAELEDVDGGVAAVKEKIDDELSGRRTHWSLRSDTGFREAAERQADIDQQMAEAEQQAAAEVGQDLDMAVMPEELAAEGLHDDAQSVARDELAARAEAIEEGVLERLAMQHDTDDAYWLAVAEFLEEREHAPVRDDAQDHRARQAEGEGSGVPADDGAPAPAAAEAESGEGGREKVDGDVPPGGRFPSGAPREHAEYLKESEYEKSLRSTYSTGKQPVSSRTTPQTAEIPAVGTWMIDDRYEGQDGHEIYELRELDVDDLEISEDTGPEKWADVKRYAQWLLEGKEAPPIRVLQHESGYLKVSDHRRLMAAKAAGLDTIKAWVSWSTRSSRYGDPIVGMTYELAERGNKRLPIVPAREDRKIFPDDARALERIQRELADETSPASADKLKSLIDRYKPGNPFAERAARARIAHERNAGPTARDQAMANAFPLGAGFGRKGDEKRMDATIDRAKRAVQALKDAEHLEAQAAAFDRGEINGQGLRITPESVARSEKRQAGDENREARKRDAIEKRGDKEPWQVPVGVWADSTGNFGGGARKLIESEHREAVENAVAEGKPIPAEVLADYPDIRPPLDLAAQTEADLRAKESREADQAAADRETADRERDAFALSAPTPPAEAGGSARNQPDLFGAQGMQERPRGEAPPANTGGGLFAQPANPMVAVADALAQAADAIKAAVQPQGNQPSGRQAQQLATLEAIADPALGMTERDLGLAEAAQNPEQRNANPEAESQAPASSGDGDGGVAPTRSGVAPEASEDEKPAELRAALRAEQMQPPAFSRLTPGAEEGETADYGRNPEDHARAGRGRRSGQVGDRTVGGGSPAVGWAQATRIQGKGGPRAFFRGSASRLVEGHFDQAALGRASGNPSSGLGVWFTHSEEEAGRYGRVEEFKLDLRNPKPIRVDELPPFDSVEEAYRWRESLRSQGFDGLLINGRPLGGNVHVVAFSPEQVIRESGAFSRQAGDRAGTQTAAVEGWIAAVRKGWANAPRIVVAASIADPRVPQDIRDLDARQRRGGATGAPEAVYLRGTVYLFADQIKSTWAAYRALFHEVLGHHGLRGVFGKHLDGILEAVAASMPSEVARIAGEYGLDPANRADRLVAAEEVLSNLAQTRPQAGIVRRAVAAIRQFLRDLGVDLKLSDNDIVVNFILPARAFVERGAGRRTESARPAPAFGRDQTKTAAFRKWFGDSKVVDRNGEPVSEVLIDNRSDAARELDAKKPGLMPRAQMVQPGFDITDAMRDKVGGGMPMFSRGPRAMSEAEARAAGFTLKAYRGVSKAKPFNDSGTVWATTNRDVAESYAEEVFGYDDADVIEVMVNPAGIPQHDIRRMTEEEIKAAGPDESGNPQAIGIYRNSDDSLLGSGYRHTAIHVPVANVVRIDDTPAFSRGLSSIAGGQTGAASAQPGNRASWDAGEPSKLDKFIRVLQDKNIDAKRVVQAIRNAVGAISDATDVYLQEELFHGRTAKGVEDFLDDELRPLFTEMAGRGVTTAELEEYLHNRHAEEANEHIAAINPSLPDGGSGIDTADAQAYLAALTPEKRRALEALAAKVDAIQKRTRDELVAYGLESRETVTGWEQMFDHYVPLHREDMDGGPGIGQGFSVRGPASKSRTGSRRAVVDILANIAMQRERAVVRGEKNRVALALVGLVEQNPNPDFWRVDRPPMIQRIDDRTGLVRSYVDPLYKSRDNVVVARMPDASGEVIERAVVFNEHDERARRMAAALKNLDAEDLGEVLGLAAKATRYFASINTQYNPIFGVVNLIRDAQGALFNLSTTPIHGKQAEVLRHTIDALRGIYIDAREARAGRQPNSVWAREWEEFTKAGGQTGFRDMFRTSKDRAEAIEREIKRVTEGRATQFGRAVFDWLSDYNLAMENAIRLAAFRAGKDAGMSVERAASMAKNLTVNFNRKGTAGTQAGALYAFFNASVQGTARLAETLAGPAGKKIIAGGLTLGVVQALALAAAGFDEDEPPDFVRERNLILPIGGGKYVTIPMPLGLHILPNLARIPTEYALGGFRDGGKKVAELVSVFAEAFNPMGNAGLSLQTLAPTVIDPVAALAENKDWTGKPIAREDFNKMAPTPGFTRARDTASWPSRAVSRALNWMTGGTDYKPGAFSPTPDQIDYLIGQLTGGLGREAQKVEQTATSAISGDELPAYKIPLFGRFYGTTQGQAPQASRFYENLRAINEHEAEIKGRRKAGEPVGEYLRENPEAGLWQLANRVERQVSELRRRRRELLEKDAGKDAVHAIDARLTAIMKSFNDRVRMLREKAAA